MRLFSNLFILLFAALVLSLVSYCNCRHHHHHHHHQHHYQQHHHNPNHYNSHDHKHKHHQANRIHKTRFDHQMTATKNQDEDVGSSSRLFKRQAVELAVNRLHILESLDGQLRQFADLATTNLSGDNLGYTDSPQTNGSLSSSRSALPSISQLICSLHLNFKRPEVADGCLANPFLKRHIPPYMLNLHQQLLSECRTLAEAVQQMPYKSLIMRSFRQPALKLEAENSAASEVDEFDHDKELEEPNLVVELSALDEVETTIAHYEGQEDLDDIEHTGPIGESSLGNNLNEEEFNSLHNKEPSKTPTNLDSTTKMGACDLRQRSLVAGQRSELCYWFQIGEQLQRKINGSLTINESRPMSKSDSEPKHKSRKEKLVEAELHLFKLMPELSSTNQQQQQINPSADFAEKDGQQFDDNKQTTSRQLSKAPQIYHLKTNLLEVSLYQILPKKSKQLERRRNYSIELEKVEEKANNELDDEFPLRLLDIRRIDLYSSGWETFYVKRAVEDWIKDESLNLGLVIKAKSMFEEPIRIGLIRFADLYDNRSQEIAANNMGRKMGRKRRRKRGEEEQLLLGKEQQREVKGGGEKNMNENENVDENEENSFEAKEKRSLEFNLNHQPILVIYTTTTTN